jgi:hypothetical protein
MPETWMVDECRRQALLYLTHASRTVAADGAFDMPEPLLSRESAARLRLRDEAANVRGTRSGIEVVVQRVKSLFPADDSGQVGVPDGWSYAELVGWWIQAGEALRGWHQEDARQCARLVSPARGGLYPPFWCESRFERLRFSFDSWQQIAVTAGTPGPDWRGVGKTRRDHRLKLLKWVMQPRRPRPGRPDPARQSQEWLQSLRQEFASVLQDAEELFGSECGLESGGPLTVETVREWAPSWHAGTFAGGLVHEVRRPVIQSAGERSALIKGIAVLPPASFIVRRITASGAPGGGAVAGWRAALEFAASCWGVVNPADGAAVPPPVGAWKRADDGETAMLTPGDLDAGLVAVARLLVAITSDQNQVSAAGNDDDTGRTDRDALRVTLAFEGFSLQSAPGQGAALGRTIPHGGPGPADGVLQLTLRVALPNPGSSPVACDIDLGALGRAAACSDSLLAAVEAVDWRTWALEKAPFPKDVSRRRNLILETVNHRAWEKVKTPVLVRAGEAAEIILLFAHAHRARLGLATFLAASEDVADQDLGGSLLHDLDALRRVTLAEAVAIDPQALERCWPPRQGDGSVNVVRWLRQRLTSEADHDDTILVWASVGSAFGMPVDDERLDGQGRLVVTVSAGPVGEGEIACLNMPLPMASAGAGNGLGGRSLRTVIAEFQGRLIESLSRSTPHALDAELPALRSRLAGADAAAFHELIDRARQGDAVAVAWLDLLASDPRFDFRCHPRLTFDRTELEPPGVDDAYLTWAYDSAVPAGTDITVAFALDPRRARRAISRGLHEPGTATDLADRLVTAAAAAGEQLRSAAVACRDATDRWQMFGETAVHPLTQAGPLLDAIPTVPDLDTDVRQAVFVAAARWCAALGHELLPAGWRAGESLPAEQFADLELTPAFHESVPAGEFMLKRLGVRGPHGMPLEGAVSAGPAPAGFHELRVALQELGNSPELGHNPKLADLAKRINDLAKQAVSSRLPMVVPNLFDGLWGAAEASPVPLQPGFEPAKGHLLQLLKSSCRMVVFEPAKLTDYPSEWCVGPDGKRPSGNRIRKVLRPGVRTLSSSLVRPAIVETE